MGPYHNKAWLQFDKKQQNLMNSIIFLKTISFKVRKTIRYQLKLSKLFNHHCYEKRALGPV